VDLTKRDSRRKLGADITVDDILLRALEGGPVTVNDILKRFGARVRPRLEKLRVRGLVVRENRGRAHREFTYQFCCEGAQREGGLSPAAKVTPSERQ
jgi:hypothetical protein